MWFKFCKTLQDGRFIENIRVSAFKFMFKVSNKETRTIWYLIIISILITYPVSSDLCKNISLQCHLLYNFPSFRSSHWRCSVRKSVLRNFAKFTGKHLWQSLFFNMFTGWGDCFWSFSCLLLKICCLFHFNRKTRETINVSTIAVIHYFF